MDGDKVKVEDSILLSIKKLLGMDPIEFTQYDTDIIIHINTIIEFLNQLGIDIPEGFKINDENLIDLTGGVVQGMSGSPIIQNDNLIGVLTHVVVDNPYTGYGLFITKMLEEGEK